MYKIKTHFEIGHLKYFGHDVIGETLLETESVFHANSLTECINEWRDKNYSEPEYFIDVWETDSEGIPFPVGDIKMEKWMF